MTTVLSIECLEGFHDSCRPESQRCDCPCHGGTVEPDVSEDAFVSDVPDEFPGGF